MYSQMLATCQYDVCAVVQGGMFLGKNGKRNGKKTIPQIGQKTLNQQMDRNPTIIETNEEKDITQTNEEMDKNTNTYTILPTFEDVCNDPMPGCSQWPDSSQQPINSEHVSNAHQENNSSKKEKYRKPKSPKMVVYSTKSESRTKHIKDMVTSNKKKYRRPKILKMSTIVWTLTTAAIHQITE